MNQKAIVFSWLLYRSFSVLSPYFIFSAIGGFCS